MILKCSRCPAHTTNTDASGTPLCGACQSAGPEPCKCGAYNGVSFRVSEEFDAPDGSVHSVKRCRGTCSTCGSGRDTDRINAPFAYQHFWTCPKLPAQINPMTRIGEALERIHLELAVYNSLRYGSEADAMRETMARAIGWSMVKP